MKAQKIIYWISTVLISVMMIAVAIGYLTQQPKMMEGFASLGYPPYFAKILGIAKILGAITLLVPGFRILKEWAYAGFVITFVSAFISHLEVGQNQEAIAPVVALLLLAASYLTRPPDR